MKKLSKKDLNWIVRRILLVIYDICAVNASFFSAILVRFYFNDSFTWLAEKQYIPAWITFTPWYTLACIIIFIIFGLYRSRLRSAGYYDLSRIVLANLVCAVVQVAGSCLFVCRMPVTYYFIGAVVQLTLIILSRFSLRILDMFSLWSRRRRAGINTMIVGNGETAHVLRSQIEKDPDSVNRLVCFFSDREHGITGTSDGLPVYGDINKFEEIIDRHGVRLVLLADSLLREEVRRQIREICKNLKIEVQDFSGYLQNDGGTLTLQKLIERYQGPVSVLSENVLQDFDNGEQVLMTIARRREVKNLYIKDNRLIVELSDLAPMNTFLTLMYITNRPDVALVAEKYGVDRIWIDLETLGKEKRQRGLNTVKSDHTVADIAAIKPLLTTAEMLVRVNKWNDGSPEEIDAVINAGADLIMLPYWKTKEEVEKFLNCVNGRCRTVLLLETKKAVECVDEVLKLKFDEIHIGLNDLYLSYGMTFMFEPLANGMVEMLCQKFKKKGIPYGFGGIARLGAGMLSAEKIIMEHYRLGSTRAILSRSFCDYKAIGNIEEIEAVFRENMNQLQEYELSMADKLPEEFALNRMSVKDGVDAIVEQIVAVRNNGL